jgi:hypothetical protein
MSEQDMKQTIGGLQVVAAAGGLASLPDHLYSQLLAVLNPEATYAQVYEVAHAVMTEAPVTCLVPVFASLVFMAAGSDVQADVRDVAISGVANG